MFDDPLKLQREQQESADAANRVMLTTSGYTPGDFAKAVPMAPKMNTDPYSLATTPTVMNQAQKEAGLVRLFTHSPEFREFVMRDPEAISYVGENIGAFVQMSAHKNRTFTEEMAVGFKAAAMHDVPSMAVAARVYLNEGRNVMNASALFDMVAKLEADPEADYLQLMETSGLSPRSKAGLDMAAYMNAIERGDEDAKTRILEKAAFRFTENKAAMLELNALVSEFNKTRPPTAQFSMDNWRDFSQFAASSIGSGIPYLVLAAASTATGGSAGALAFGLGLGVGDMAKAVIDDGGDVSDVQVQKRIALTAPLYALTEQIGAGASVGAKFVARMGAKTVTAKAVKQGALAWAKRTGFDIAKNGVEEGVNEFLQAVLTDYAKDGDVDTSPEALEGYLVEAIGGAIAGVAFGGASTVFTDTVSKVRTTINAKARQANGNAATMTDLNETAEKLAEHPMPEAAKRRYLQDLGLDEAQIYVDAESLSAEIEAGNISLETLGMTQEVLSEAIKEGRMVSISKADYVLNVAPTEAGAWFAENSTQHPRAMSKAEAETTAEVLADLDEDVQRIEAGEQAQNTTIRQVQDNVQRMLVNSGSYDRTTSKQMATMVSAFVKSVGSRSSIGIERMVENMGLTVRGPAQQMGRALTGFKVPKNIETAVAEAASTLQGATSLEDIAAPVQKVVAALDQELSPQARQIVAQAVSRIQTADNPQAALEALGELLTPLEDVTDLDVAGQPLSFDVGRGDPGAVTLAQISVSEDASTGETTGVPMPTRLTEASRIAQEEQFAKGRDFKMRMQELALESQKGGLDLTKQNDEVAAAMVDFLVADAKAAAVHNQNAVGWYDANIGEALETLSEIYPEIKTDEESKFAFTWALAVTSNGLKVDKNFQLAEQAYLAWKSADDKTFPTDIGIGEAAGAINRGLSLYPVLVERLGSVDALIKFMTTEATAKEVEQVSGVAVSGEHKSTRVRGSAILGSKIGEGFFSNLYGYFDALTMDRWLVRTIGRWRGTLIESRPDMVEKKHAQIKEVIGSLTAADRKYLTGFFNGTDIKVKNRMSAAELDALGMEVNKRSTAPSWRAAINEAVGGEDIRKLGNALAKYLDGQIEQPKAAQRNFYRGVFKQGLETLRADPDLSSLTMADLQALLWYPEKLLYDSAKKKEGEEVLGYDDDEAPNYANAARALVSRHRSDATGSGLGDLQSVAEEAVNAVSEGDRVLAQDKRGQITFPNTGAFGAQSVIDLFEQRNESTFIHEAGHMFLEVFRSVAALEPENSQIRADLAQIHEWMGKTDNDPYTTREQEMWARGFETYTATNRAPASGLRDAFNSFARWLKQIYSAAIAGGINPTPEIRAVMDRMLATDAELAAATIELAARQEFSDIPPGISADEWQAYERVAAQDKERAEEQATRAAMEAIAKRRSKEWREARNGIADTVAKEVAQRPEYILLERVTKRKKDHAPQLDRKELVDTYGPDILAELDKEKFGGQRNVYAPGGASLGITAEMSGFDSADEMVNALRSAQSIGAAVSAETDRRMEKEYGNPYDAEMLRAEAEAAVKNTSNLERTARAISMIDKMAGKRVGPNRWQVANAAAAAEARERLGKLDVRDILIYDQFLRNSTKANRAANKALAKIAKMATANRATGKGAELLTLAAKEKRKALLNDHMFRQARDRARVIRKAQKEFRKFRTKKERAKLAPYIDAIEALMDKYSFDDQTRKQIDSNSALAGFYDSMVEAGREAELAFSRQEIVDAHKKNFRDMTGDEAQAVIDQIRNIEYMGRQANKSKLEAEKATRDQQMSEIAGEAAQNLQEVDIKASPSLRRTTRARLKDNINSLVETVLNVDSVVALIDGNQLLGPAYRYLKAPIDKAVADKSARLDEASKKIATIYSDLFTEAEMREMSKPEFIPELGETYTKWDVIGMALNTGNDINFERLTNTETGKGAFESSALEAVLTRMMTDKDWQHVQNVWDYVNSFWPEIAAMEKLHTGLTPEKVQSNIKVGAPAFVTGGYYPIKYDRELSPVSNENINTEEFMKLQGGNFAKAQTVHGHTEARLESTKQPLLLDAHLWHRHVFDVVHDLTLRTPVNEVAKLIAPRGSLSNTMHRYGQDSRMQLMRLWLRDVAVGQKTSLNGIEKFSRQMRFGFTVGALSFKLWNVIQQPFGVFHTFASIGTGNTLKGYGTYMANPAMWTAKALQSTAMQERQNNMNRELADINNAVRTKSFHTGVLHKAGHNAGLFMALGMRGMTISQFYVVDLPTWVGAYEKARSEGSSDADATIYADRVVRTAQGSGFTSDRSALERGTFKNMQQAEIMKVFTVLGSYMFAKFNLAAVKTGNTNFASPKQVLNWAADMFLLFAAESIMLYLMKNQFDKGEDDEDASWARIFARETFYTAMGTMPLLREFASAQQGYGGGTAMSDYIEMVSDTFTEGAEIFIDGEMPDEKDFKRMMLFPATLMKMPTGQMRRTLDALYEDDWSVRNNWEEHLVRSFTHPIIPLEKK